MDVLVILCHPREGSFNRAVAERVVETLVEQGHASHLHDLYAEGFDPVLSSDELSRGLSFDEKVLAYSRELTVCSGLVFVHPEWWGGPPALLKGWLERVFRPGVAYEFEGPDFLRKQKTPLLGGKRALVFATSHETESGQPGLLERFWLEAVFGYCGLQQAACHVLRNLHRLEQGQRTAWLERVTLTVRACFPPL